MGDIEAKFEELENVTRGTAAEEYVTALKNMVVNRECPDCEGDGEIYIGPSMVPDDEGFETCSLCSGSGKFPTIDQIRKTITFAFDMHIESQMKGLELAQHKDYIKALKYYRYNMIQR